DGVSEIQVKTREMARARGTSLLERPDAERVDFAVALIEASIAVAGSDLDILPTLGEALLARANRRNAGNDHTNALDDARRAFELLPRSRDSRDMYACALVYVCRTLGPEDNEHALELL